MLWTSIPLPRPVISVWAAVEEARKHEEDLDHPDQNNDDEENQNEVAHQVEGLRHGESSSLSGQFTIESNSKYVFGSCLNATKIWTQTTPELSSADRDEYYQL